jgi:hypothetical protein
MTFLQPLLLYGLPAILVPVLIHLLNKRRHRTLMWAATMFLVRATRQSRGRRKLKHFLILACRVLAVAALIFALSRPLAGGWVSWLGGNRPEAILVLLDRSASMDAAPGETLPAKRENAIERLAAAAREFASGSRLVVFDSAGGDPVEIASADALPALAITAPSQTAADLPGMLERALDYLATAKPGRAEIWIASDLQATNWNPADGRWQSLRAAYQRLGQEPPVRILGLTEPTPGSHSLRLEGLTRDRDGLVLDLEIRHANEGPVSLPLTLALDGSTGTQESIAVSQPRLTLRKRVPLAEADTAGWGRLALGPDLSPSDNAVWFAYGPVRPLTAAVVSDEPAGRLLSLACAPPGVPDRSVTRFAPADAHQINWTGTDLIVWQAPPPVPPVSQQLEAFLEAGGSLLMFPAEAAMESPAPFLGLAWPNVETAAEDARFPVVVWEKSGGPLQDFANGQAMALDRLFVIKRRVPAGEATVLANYEDGVPAVLRVARGRGQALVVTTLGDRRWSDLGDYNVLLPLIERLARAATRYHGGAQTLDCGEPLPETTGPAQPWETLDSAIGLTGLPGINAGAFRRSDNLVAFNTPAAEFEPAPIDRAALDELFAGMRMRIFEERVTREQGLATEIWRSFAIAMLVFLIAEALLSLPARRSSGLSPAQPAPQPAA